MKSWWPGPRTWQRPGSRPGRRRRFLEVNKLYRGSGHITIFIIIPGGSVQEYKEVNAKESLELADAFLSYNFLNVTKRLLKKHLLADIIFRLNTSSWRAKGRLGQREHSWWSRLSDHFGQSFYNFYRINFYLGILYEFRAQIHWIFYLWMIFFPLC